MHFIYPIRVSRMLDYFVVISCVIWKSLLLFFWLSIYVYFGRLYVYSKIFNSSITQQLIKSPDSVQINSAIRGQCMVMLLLLSPILWIKINRRNNVYEVEFCQKKNIYLHIIYWELQIFIIYNRISKKINVTHTWV